MKAVRLLAFCIVARAASAAIAADASLATSMARTFDFDTVTPKGNANGVVLFDFETEVEREDVRKSNPDYGTLITVTNRMAASGDFALHVTGMGDAEDAKTGYYPRLLLRPEMTDWRDFDRLVVEVTSVRDSGANGVMRLFIAGPDGDYTRSFWLRLPLRNLGYRQWVVPFNLKWSNALGNRSRLFFSFEDFPEGCDVFIDRVMLLRKGSEVPRASTAFIEREAMPLLETAMEGLSATNALMAAELGHMKDYMRFCGETARSAFDSPHMAVGTATAMEKIRPRAEVPARAIPDDGLVVRLAGNEYESVQIVVAARGEDLKGVKVAVDGDLKPMEREMTDGTGGTSGTGGDVPPVANVPQVSSPVPPVAPVPPVQPSAGKMPASPGTVKPSNCQTVKLAALFAATNIACSPVGYVNVTASAKYASGYNVKVDGEPGYRRKNRKAEKGWWPDPILAFTNAVDVIGQDVQTFWVRVHCPEGQAAGTYEGAIVVSAEGVEPVRIPFKVRVNSFSLGKVSELPLMVDCAPVPHANWSVAKIQDSPFNVWKRHREEWADFLADYLISWDGIYGGALDFEILEHLRSQGRLGKRFCLGYFGAPKSTNDADVAEWLARSEKGFAEKRGIYEKAKALGILDRAYIYGWDEWNAEKFPTIRIAVEELKRQFPEVPISTTARDHSYGAALTNMDWFVPNSWEYRKERAEESRKAGHQVWWYICDGPRAPYANWFVECQAIEARLLMGAMARRMKPDGFLYFRTAMWSSPSCITNGPFTDWLVHKGKEGVANGDGYLTYVGPDGIPLPSLRLENFRDGLEDYAYAKLLEEKLREMENGKWRMENDGGVQPSNGQTVKPSNRASGAQRARAALAVPREVMDTMTNFTDDPAVLYRWRDEMADLIEKAPAGTFNSELGTNKGTHHETD